MSKHYMEVRMFMKNAEQDTPLIPCIPDKKVLELRAKLMLEEVLETINALGVDVQLKGGGLITEDGAEFIFDALRPCNLIEVVDGCCDVAVVTTGTLIACGVQDTDVQTVINESNLAKFRGDAHRRSDGKWIKPSDWQAPDIKAELLKQGAKPEDVTFKKPQHAVPPPTIRQITEALTKRFGGDVCVMYGDIIEAALDEDFSYPIRWERDLGDDDTLIFKERDGALIGTIRKDPPRHISTFEALALKKDS